MKADEVPPLRRHATFVLPKWKLVYVSTPKAACTTIKWLLADIQGIEHKVFYSSLSSETSRATTIHHRHFLWLDTTPNLRDLDDAQLAEITPENGWFSFTMTRHPGMRLWSAWQSKFLLREPRFLVQYAKEPWMPRMPRTTEDVLEDWDQFVRAAAADPDSQIMQDNHFQSQSLLLNVPAMPYYRIYDTSEFRTMLDDLRAHLDKQGWTGELEPSRSNETPLPAIERAFPQHTLDAIAMLYADDFAKLDYDDPKPPKLRTEEYGPDVLAATAMIAERGERIGDLSRRARRINYELDQCRQGRTPEPGTTAPRKGKPKRTGLLQRLGR